eukprot:Rhum_TRINITY_DN921_c0_g1::Rhum_TRINITY_DN921_c0_g1_i1::g.2775::m.2775
MAFTHDGAEDIPGEGSTMLEPQPPSGSARVQTRKLLTPAELADTQANSKTDAVSCQLMSRLYSGPRLDQYQRDAERKDRQKEDGAGGAEPQEKTGGNPQATLGICAPTATLQAVPPPSGTKKADAFARRRRQQEVAAPLAVALPPDPTVRPPQMMPDIPADASVQHIAQLTKNGCLGSKFIYMAARGRGATGPYNPYDLKVISHGDM